MNIHFTDETNVSVDFKIRPILIPSASIQKLEVYPHGSEGFGDTWKCAMSTPSGTRPVAVKSIRLPTSNDKELLRKVGQRVYHAAYLWTTLSHNHILPFEGITDDFGPLPALVFLWMENGPLSEYLKKEYSYLSSRRKSELVQQVAAGLSYLHEQDIMHGDITGTNILVDGSGNLRIADFALPMIVAESENISLGSVHSGNSRWMAPEFLDYTEEPKAPLKPTKAGDIYSFGCVMLQILSGEEPYPRIRFEVQIIGAILSGRAPFHGVKINMDDAHRLLSSRCLSKKPEGRPPIVEITTILGPSVSAAQAESDPYSPEAMLRNLTKHVVKIGLYPFDRGGFGEIWKCTCRTDQGLINVAVKSLLVRASDTTGEAMKKKSRASRLMKRIHHELKICARAAHPNILPVYGYTYGFGPFMAIVTPWAENGNLVTYLQHKDARLSVVRQFEILRDIAAGSQYLHAHNIIHGDLTGPNILIRGDGTACLTDFGLSLLYSEDANASWTSKFHGNPRWLAPERLGDLDSDALVRPTKCGDIYSFGSIMLHVLTGKIPYYYLGNGAVIGCMYAAKKPDRSRYPAFSDKYWRFIEECWSTDPLARPLAERVVEVIRDELDSLSSSSVDP